EQAHLEKRDHVAGLAVDDEVIAHAGQPRHGNDDGNVREQDCAEKGRARKRRPPPQDPICVDSGRESVGPLNVHGTISLLAAPPPRPRPWSGPEWDSRVQLTEKVARSVPPRTKVPISSRG